MLNIESLTTSSKIADVDVERRAQSSLWPIVLVVLAGGMALTVIYGYTAPFRQNQNTYFLHGMADAGVGHLADDWFAQTTDPFPVFSALIEVIYRSGIDELIAAAYALLSGLYLLGLLAIGMRLRPQLAQGPPLALFAALLLVLHSVWIGQLTQTTLGLDLRALFTSGIAGFYLLGGYLQPSVFGVLLILSVAAFMYHRPILAGALVAAAATVHPVYVLTGGVITASYLWLIGRRGGDLRRAAVVGGVTLALVLPVLAYVLVGFGPTTQETFEQANRIIATTRSPHHALPENWLGTPQTLGQILLVGVAVAAIRRSPLALILSVPAVLALSAAVYVIQTRDYSTAVTFPWRAFVIIVPLATTAVLATIVAPVAHFLGSVRYGHRIAVVLASVPLMIAVLTGLLSSKFAAQPDRAHPLASAYTFVRDTAGREDLYMVPPTVHFEDFRLSSQVRVFVDWKTHPYKDTEMIAWHNRIGMVAPVYRNERIADCQALEGLARPNDITHALTKTPYRTCEGFVTVFENDAYAVLQRIP